MAIFRTNFKRKTDEYESSLVLETYNKNRRAQNDLYKYCYNYFKKTYRSVFWVNDEDAANEIFQNSFIKLWENIENKKIYSENGILMGGDNKPLKSCLSSYFMGIAKFKYLEFVRYNLNRHSLDSVQKVEDEYNQKELIEIMYGHSDNALLEIIADLLSKMPERCRDILTKFYYEEKLDRILIEIPSITTKEALKTRKNKCITTLRVSANSIYRSCLND